MDTIDFLPERIRIQRARRKSLKRQVCLVVVVVVSLAVLGYVRQGMIGGAKAELVRLNAQIDHVNHQLALRSELERQTADLMIKKRIDDTLGSRVNALEVLAELERTLPESIFMTRLALEAVELRLPVAAAEDNAPSTGGRQTKEKVVKRVRLVFTGLAPSDVDLANFIAQMSAGRLFEDVSMGYAKNVEFHGRQVREFQASCYVVR